jgi:hypothetical protein
MVQLSEQFHFVLELLELGALHLGLVEGLDRHVDPTPVAPVVAMTQATTTTPTTQVSVTLRAPA